MTTLDDFQQRPLRHCFISVHDPAPIVRGAVEGPDGGWYWLATPEQARRVRVSEWVAVLCGGYRLDKRGNSVHSTHFDTLLDDWEPSDREEMVTEIPAELIA